MSPIENGNLLCECGEPACRRHWRPGEITRVRYPGQPIRVQPPCPVAVRARELREENT